MTIRIQNRTALVQQVPVAMPGDNEILVRVKTIAINPTDWKRACVVIETLRNLSHIPTSFPPPQQTSSSSAVSPLRPHPQLHLVTLSFSSRVDVGTICGADYAGEVVKIGPRQDPNFSLKVGDRVAGIVHGGKRFRSAWFLTTQSSFLPRSRCPQGPRCLCRVC
jgi:NADPH:quinone reductase-like Zn-dependent oxidoreductase